MGDFYVPIDFIILGMAEHVCTQIILGRPFFATAACNIDVKESRLTFDVGEHHAEFGLFKNPKSSLSTLPRYGCELAISNKPVHFIDMTRNDPGESHYDLLMSKWNLCDLALSRTRSMLLMRVI